MFYMILLIVILNLTSLSIALPHSSKNTVVTEPFETIPLGSNKCTWGPSYWCSSPEHALECNFDYNECSKYN